MSTKEKIGIIMIGCGVLTPMATSIHYSTSGIIVALLFCGIGSILFLF